LEKEVLKASEHIEQRLSPGFEKKLATMTAQGYPGTCYDKEALKVVRVQWL
jgi:hypothetical protein